MIRSLLSGISLALIGSLLLMAGCVDAPAVDTNSLRFVLAESGASTPTTAVDSTNGAVYFSWFGKGDEGESTVYVARLAAGDTMASAPVRVHPPGTTANAHAQAPPQVAVGPDGAVYVAWSTHEVIEGRRFPASNLVVAHSTDGGRTFEAPVFVNDDAGEEPAGHTFHDLAVGPDGSVYVSWLDSRGPATDVRISSSTDGGRSFSPDVVVAAETCQCCRTALVATERSVYIAWRHLYADNVRDIAFARSDDGGRSFTSPTRVRNDGWSIDGCPHSGPSIAVDAGGAIHVAWYTAAEGEVGLHHAVSTNGGRTFSEKQRLTEDVPISQARLAGDDRGSVQAAWEDPLSDAVLVGSVDEPASGKTFAGSSPDVAASATVRSFVWQNGGAIEAYVERVRR